jgi:hypothetical protein
MNSRPKLLHPGTLASGHGNEGYERQLVTATRKEGTGVDDGRLPQSFHDTRAVPAD